MRVLEERFDFLRITSYKLFEVVSNSDQSRGTLGLVASD